MRPCFNCMFAAKSMTGFKLRLFYVTGTFEKRLKELQKKRSQDAKAPRVQKGKLVFDQFYMTVRVVTDCRHIYMDSSAPPASSLPSTRSRLVAFDRDERVRKMRVKMVAGLTRLNLFSSLHKTNDNKGGVHDDDELFDIGDGKTLPEDVYCAFERGQQKLTGVHSAR